MGVRKDYEKLFASLKAPEPREGLLGDILAAIRKEELGRAVRARMYVLRSFLAVSFGGAALALNALWQETAFSGFYEYMSLAVFYPRIAILNWQDFGLAVLESMPALTLAAALMSVFLFLWSLQLAATLFRAPAPTKWPFRP